MAAAAEQIDKVRENRLRRMAERQGYRLVKSRRRDPRAIDYGRYALYDGVGFSIGGGRNGFDASLDEIAAFLEDPA